jgi:hypothetical protein
MKRDQILIGIGITFAIAFVLWITIISVATVSSMPSLSSGGGHSERKLEAKRLTRLLRETKIANVSKSSDLKHHSASLAKLESIVRESVRSNRLMLMTASTEHYVRNGLLDNFLCSLRANRLHELCSVVVIAADNFTAEYVERVRGRHVHVVRVEDDVHQVHGDAPLRNSHAPTVRYHRFISLKLLMMRHALGSLDDSGALVWSDADAVVLAADLPLELAKLAGATQCDVAFADERLRIDVERQQALGGADGKDGTLSIDLSAPHAINAGFYVARRSAATLRLYDAWIDVLYESWHSGSLTKEQPALKQVLSAQRGRFWPASGWPSRDDANARGEQRPPNICLLPQRSVPFWDSARHRIAPLVDQCRLGSHASKCASHINKQTGIGVLHVNVKEKRSKPELLQTHGLWAKSLSTCEGWL